VAGEVVEDHDVAGPQLRHEHLFDEGFEHVGVDRAVDDRRAADARGTQGGDERRRRPVAVGDFGHQALAHRRARPRSRVVLVLAQVSSMKISRGAARPGCSCFHARRFSATLGRSRSAACTVFF
jgi:hypothetical protein